MKLPDADDAEFIPLPDELKPPRLPSEKAAFSTAIARTDFT
jgi:hypothetical protein